MIRKTTFTRATVLALSFLILAQPALAAETSPVAKANIITAAEAGEESEKAEEADTQVNESALEVSDNQAAEDASENNINPAEELDHEEQSIETEQSDAAATAGSEENSADSSTDDQEYEEAGISDTDTESEDKEGIEDTELEADALSTSEVTAEELIEDTAEELQASKEDLLNISWTFQREGLYFSWNNIGNTYKVEIYKNGSFQYSVGQTDYDFYFGDEEGWKNGDKLGIKVTAYAGNNHQVINAIRTPDVLYCAAPESFSVTNGIKGITLSWKSVKGAEGYRIYYCPKGGNWKKLTDVKGTAFTWAGAKLNQRYSFSVRCIDSNGKIASCDAAAKAITYLLSPEFTSIVGDKDKITLKWNRIDGISKYRIYYCPKGGSWKRLTETADNTAVLKNPMEGKRYYFTVRNVDQNGNLMDALPAASYLYTKAPKITLFKNYKGYVELKWSKVSGATSYVGYLCKEGGKWERLGVTKKTSNTITGMENGCKYYFTVRAISDDGKFIMSPSSNCKSFTYCCVGEKRGKYKDCSSAFTQLNDFRTKKSVWEWNPDNKTKTYYNTNSSNTLKKLKWSKKLEKAAKIRAEELVVDFNGFHVRPHYEMFYTAAPAGTQYVAECISRNRRDVTAAMKQFYEEAEKYDGQGHRRALLMNNINAVGIACYEFEGTKYWVISLGIE